METHAQQTDPATEPAAEPQPQSQPRTPPVAPAPQTYRSVPHVVEAIRWDGSAAGLTALRAFLGPALIAVHDRGWISIQAGRLTQRGSIGDWIVKGADGLFRLLAPAVFDELYVAAEPPVGGDA